MRGRQGLRILPGNETLPSTGFVQAWSSRGALPGLLLELRSTLSHCQHRGIAATGTLQPAPQQLTAGTCTKTGTSTTLGCLGKRSASARGWLCHSEPPRPPGTLTSPCPCAQRGSLPAPSSWIRAAKGCGGVVGERKGASIAPESPADAGEVQAGLWAAPGWGRAARSAPAAPQLTASSRPLGTRRSQTGGKVAELRLEAGHKTCTAPQRGREGARPHRGCLVGTPRGHRGHPQHRADSGQPSIPSTTTTSRSRAEANPELNQTPGSG